MKKVDRSQAGRILKLTSLAPEIVEAILAGNEPDGLSLRSLRKGFSDVWSEQRTELVDQTVAIAQPGIPGPGVVTQSGS